MRSSSVGLLLMCVVAAGAASAQGRLLERLNNAARKVEEAAERTSTAPAPTPAPAPASARPAVVGGATSFTALDDNAKCLAPLNGYRPKITADMLEAKLKTAPNLTVEQRAAWQADIAAVRAAQAAGTDTVASPDPKEPNRYLSHLTTDEQTELNRQYGQFYNEVSSRCMGADHLNVGRTTPMNYIQNTAAADRQRAQQDANINAMQQCMAELQGLRWKVLADKLEAKMATQTLSAADRAAWEADIAVARQAQASGGATMPQSPDPQNPMRWMMRLSPEEQLAWNQEAADATTQRSAQCTSSTPIVEREIESGGLVDRSRSPANRNARPQQRAARNTPAPQGGALGAGRVDGLKEWNECYEPLRGHLAKVTAEALEAKLVAAGTLSAQQRAEWEADIASWRAAEQAGLDRAEPADPANPYRWEDRLTRDERAAINGKHAQFNNQIVRDCGARDSNIGSQGFN
jgi:hypothetical protein